jgi:hypothetical protein
MRVPRHQRADHFGGLAHGIIEQMRIAVRGLRLGMAEHLPDQRQRRAT